MRTKHLTLICIIFCLSLSSKTAAQVLPGPAQVNALIDAIKYCDKLIVEAEKALDNMEKNPSEGTYKEYKDWQKIREDATRCAAENRVKLEKLRKEYPGWFNQPSTTVDLGRAGHMTARQLEDLLAEVEAKMDDILKRFLAIPEPTKGKN